MLRFGKNGTEWKVKGKYIGNGKSGNNLKICIGNVKGYFENEKRSLRICVFRWKTFLWIVPNKACLENCQKT